MFKNGSLAKEELTFQKNKILDDFGSQSKHHEGCRGIPEAAVSVSISIFVFVVTTIIIEI